MRNLITLLAAASLVACSGGDGLNGPNAPAACTNDAQKQFVLDNLYAWYLWNDLLPANIDIADYATPEALATQVTETYGPQKPGGGPLDRFSSVGSLAADQQFFGEGKYEGFGFSWRIEGGDMRFTRVFVDSPANIVGGFERGQTVLSLDGRTMADITANEGINAALDNATVEFEIENLDTSTFTVSVTKDIVTIDPIPQWRVINMGQGAPPVGYMELATFISTANSEFATVFTDFINAGVNDVIIDMRYNGGGLVSTAELLGDYLGGFANDGLVFSNMEFNADRAPANNRSEFFERRGSSIDISRLIIVASKGTASASELVTNSLIPYADVWIVGDDTFGKPVGQVGLDFCDKILRPTSFQTTNADRDGDYFDGLPVDCVATDTLDVPIGADNDPHIVAATTISATGGCPVMSLPGNQQKVDSLLDLQRPDLVGPPEREYAGAF